VRTYRDYSLVQRRLSFSRALDEVRVSAASCFSRRSCDHHVLPAWLLHWQGAFNGVRFTNEADHGAPAIPDWLLDVSRSGFLVFSTPAQIGASPDYWLVGPNVVLRVEENASHTLAKLASR